MRSKELAVGQVLYLIGLLLFWRIQQAVLLNGTLLGSMAVQVVLALRSMLDSLISTATARDQPWLPLHWLCTASTVRHDTDTFYFLLGCRSFG